MIVKEYGDSKNNTIMLLHGGGLSWWNYRDEIEKLQSSFHVIIPILDGHSDSDRNFTSIEDNAQEIIDYITNNYEGHIHLIGGLSLGGQILLEILSRKNDICDYAIVESALGVPMKANSKYELKETLRDTKARVLVIVGGKERPIMKKSADLISKKIGSSRVEIIPNYSHGELSINNSDRYISLMNELIAN